MGNVHSRSVGFNWQSPQGDIAWFATGNSAYYGAGGSFQVEEAMPLSYQFPSSFIGNGFQQQGTGYTRMYR